MINVNEKPKDESEITSKTDRSFDIFLANTFRKGK